MAGAASPGEPGPLAYHLTPRWKVGDLSQGN
jgi:hypothetical protein